MVLLVDADPQGSSLAWPCVREKAPLFPVVGMAKPTLHKDLPQVAKNYDVVVIDGVPRVNDLGRSAIMERPHRDRRAALALRCVVLQ